MPKTHTEETCRKISDGLRRHYEKKRAEIRPTHQRRVTLAKKFAAGHPDGMQINTVRNYGGLGPDVKAIEPRTSTETVEAKLQEARDRKSASLITVKKDASASSSNEPLVELRRGGSGD